MHLTLYSDVALASKKGMKLVSKPWRVHFIIGDWFEYGSPY